MRVRLVLVVFAVSVANAACGTAAADGPPEINYGRDICVQCNMIISEIGHAAAYRLADGTEKQFDGVGEMVLHARNHAEVDQAEAWVHDYWSEDWVRAEDAYYVPTRAVASPMGHGIFAFATEERAAAFATDVGGEVIDWHTVLQIPIADGLVGGAHGQTDETTHDHDSKTDEMEEDG
jgi:copper chaperone NosL